MAKFPPRGPKSVLTCFDQQHVLQGTGPSPGRPRAGIAHICPREFLGYSYSIAGLKWPRNAAKASQRYVSATELARRIGSAGHISTNSKAKRCYTDANRLSARRERHRYTGIYDVRDHCLTAQLPMRSLRRRVARVASPKKVKR